MHFAIALALICGFCLVLIFGLLSVLQDLLSRNFHAVPVMAERESPAECRPPLHLSGGQPG
jgi:hypothetical protein